MRASKLGHFFAFVRSKTPISPLAIPYSRPCSASALLLKNYCTPIKGGGARLWHIMPLYSYAMQLRRCSQDLSMPGAKARERSDRAGEGRGRGVVSLSYGTESFEYSCMKTAFSCTLHVDTIVRGNLCTGIDQFPTLSFLILFLRLMNLSFSISFSFSFFFPPPLLFCQPIVGGGGHVPPVVTPLGTHMLVLSLW